MASRCVTGRDTENTHRAAIRGADWGAKKLSMAAAPCQQHCPKYIRAVQRYDQPVANYDIREFADAAVVPGADGNFRTRVDFQRDNPEFAVRRLKVPYMSVTWFPDVRVPALRGGPVLRWGVLAPGIIAGDFTATVLANTDQRVTAVASRSVERATRFAAQHGIDRVSESYEQLVSDPEVDVVYVAAPHSEHRALSLLAISAGKHVLIEKPIAISAAEAEEIAAAARSAGVFATEAMWTRYLPQFDVLHQVLERRDLGSIRLATADVGWPIGPGAPADRP